MLILLAIVLMLPAVGFSQADKSQSVWEPLKPLVGSWEGTGKGQPGSSRVEREYQFVEVYTETYFKRKK